MAKPGSRLSAFWKASAASSNSKLYRSFTPSTKKGWAAAEPEVGKETVPSFWAAAEIVARRKELNSIVNRRPGRKRFAFISVSRMRRAAWLPRKSRTGSPRAEQANSGCDDDRELPLAQR